MEDFYRNEVLDVMAGQIIENGYTIEGVADYCSEDDSEDLFLSGFRLGNKAHGAPVTLVIPRFKNGESGAEYYFADGPTRVTQTFLGLLAQAKIIVATGGTA